jgi:hypothetical protein
MFILRRSSPYVVLMPHVRRHRRCFPGCGYCAWCAAVRQGPRSRPGLLPARVVPAVAVNGARLPRRSFVSLLVLPGSAVRAAAAALHASWPCCTSPLLPGPRWSGSCQSGDITLPNDSQERHRLPSAARKSRWGGQNKRPPLPGAISRCNQILTKLASLPAAPERERWRLTSRDRL